MNETPNTVHGRLLESAHIAGYTFKRAWDELKWLLQEDRWKQLGFEDGSAFAKSIHGLFSEFRGTIDQRKEVANALTAIASQRAVAEVLGVSKDTVAGDLGKRGENSPRRQPNPQETASPDDTSGENSPPDSPAAFQRDVDPYKQAKKQERQDESRRRRLDNLAEISKGNVDLSIAERFPVIYADPPWRYENPPIGASNRSIENHYPTMTLDEICALPICDLATEDAILYLWATAPKLGECMQVIAAWGFVYRTNLVWDKEIIGTGYHARNQHELLLVARRGEMPAPAAGTQAASVHRERRSDHSVKPAFFAKMIERLYPELPRVELFQRGENVRPGWAVWGNQSGTADAA